MNDNRISDAWEKTYFDSVATNRTQWTDTDGDGLPDYAEFIAGTDPTNTASKFVLLSATAHGNQFAQCEWTAIPGRMYRVEISTNLATWEPHTDWLGASASTMSCSNINLGAAVVSTGCKSAP